MPLIPALGRQRQPDLHEFEANLVYKSYFQDRLQSYRETMSQTTTKNQTNNNKKTTTKNDLKLQKASTL